MIRLDHFSAFAAGFALAAAIDDLSRGRNLSAFINLALVAVNVCVFLGKRRALLSAEPSHD
jgi:hypothetical protein